MSSFRGIGQIVERDPPPPPDSPTLTPPPTQSAPATAPPPQEEKAKIDAENRALLQSMTREEILDAQRDVLESLPAELVTFLKERKRQ